MKTVKIGVFDEEEGYVERLAGSLNRQGRGCWNVAGFTNRTILEDYLKKRNLDVLAVTNREELLELQRKYQEICFVWLSENGTAERIADKKDAELRVICRYQSAKAIGKAMREVLKKIGSGLSDAKPMAAVYSPIGRCGKTSFALEIAKNECYGKWLYIGMEDYSSFRETEERSGIGDTFLYYVKERKKKKAAELIEESNGIIASAFSIFDAKQIEKNDVEFIEEILRESSFEGAIFDVGSGILQDFSILTLFDVIVVPYLSAESSMIKKERFEQLLYLYGLEEVLSKIQYINMERSKEVLEKMEELFLKAYGD